MIKVTVGEIQRHDKVRVSEQGGDYTVSSISTDNRDTNLKNVYVMSYERPLLVTTPATEIWATSMVREIEVACLALTHPGEEPAKMLHDLAKGPRPRGIFCGDCAAAADDSVL